MGFIHKHRYNCGICGVLCEVIWDEREPVVFHIVCPNCRPGGGNAKIKPAIKEVGNDKQPKVQVPTARAEGA